MSSRSIGTNAWIAAVVLVAAAGCTSVPNAAHEGAVAPIAAPASEARAAVPQDAAAIVASQAFQALSSKLAAWPGFTALAPTLDGSHVLNAVFSGPAPPATLWPAPSGWDLRMLPNAKATTLRHEGHKAVGAPGIALPESSTGIGPGAALLTTIPGEGTFICTANFVYTNGTSYFLGAAGHCFLPEGTISTYGSDADYDASGVVTEVCVAACYFGGELTGFLGDFRTLGSVVFARQSEGGLDIGHDFGAVEIPSSLESLMNPEMPVWGGPVGAQSSEGTGAYVVHYGNGIDSGTVFATKGRAGVTLNDGDASSWQAVIQINGGDSGSAINLARLSTGNGLEGRQALGLITHGVIVPGVALGWGTTIGKAVSMADDAGYTFSVVEP